MYKLEGRHNVEFRESLTAKEIDEIASNPDVKALHCASPAQSRTWDLLNQNLFSNRPDIELRVYGFYSSICDLSFVTRLPNVRRFTANCLMRAVGVENLSSLKQLEELSVGIYSLENFDFLTTLPVGMKSLFLGATKSKKPRLDALNRFRSLRKLYIEGQQNGIVVLAELQELEELTLRSISTPDLEYLARLPRLWSLDIKLGGIRNLSAIAGRENIKYLELWQIRGLSDISFISCLTGLQLIFLQALRNVSSIPDLSKLARLRRLYLENMKGLRDISAIRYAPALEQFIHVAAQNIRPVQYEDLVTHPTLEELHIGFGSKTKNDQFESLVTQSGKRKFQGTQFVFQ